MKNLDDNKLMVMVIRKDAKAFRVLYERYEVKIFNFIYRSTGSRELAQELLQETFVKVWKSAHQFSQQKGRFKGWLYTVALNLTRSEMSRKEYSCRYSEIDDNFTGEEEGREVSQPHTEMEQEEMKRKIMVALKELPPFQREVIVMKLFEHLKFREISEITETPVGTLKARFHRAVETLKSHFEEGEVAEYVS